MAPIVTTLICRASDILRRDVPKAVCNYAIRQPPEIVWVLRGRDQGGVDVVVMQGARVVATHTRAFTFTGTVATRLHRVVPARGPVEGGAEVLVTGRGLCERARVLFGAVPGRVTERVSERALRVRTPAAAPGAVGLRVVGCPGGDGTDGAAAIKAAGGSVFAQDAHSCVVYGMPASVVAAGVVDAQADPEQLAALITGAL